MSLDEFAIKHGTDKASPQHSYTQYYDMFFYPIRDHRVNLMEIGVDAGASLKMWADYFCNGNIHGVDIRGGYEYLEVNKRIKTHIVDQSKRGELIAFAEQYTGYFDIIIDDGSHQSADMILSFETLFPYLKSGGYYIIEDLLCDYDSRWNKGVSIIDRIKTMIGEVNMNGAIPNSHICANKKEAVKKYDAGYFEKNIEWTFNACGTTIIKKM